MTVKWYESNKKLFVEEQDSLTDRYPFLKLEIVPRGTRINKVCILKAEAAIVSGIHRLYIPESQRYLDYRIAIILPDNYPRSAPWMYCNDKKLPIGNIDRHIYGNGSACLGVNAEISQKWQSSPRIVLFLDDIVAPFLIWQAYYDEHGQPPPWGQRSHYAQGVLEFYAELLQIEVDSTVKDFINLLARKNQPKGHEMCPCGSGLRLRSCHFDLVQQVRKKIAWEDVRNDISLIVNDSKRIF